MSETTQHGENIAEQVQSEDAYGAYNALTLADVWLILDNIQTHFMDTNSPFPIVETISEWLRKLEELDPDLPI